MSRDTAAMNFPVITFYDGQGFLVRKSLAIMSVKQLDRATICLQQGTTTELNLADWFRTRGLTYKVVTFANSEQTLGAYESGRCDAYSTDKSSLYGERLKTAHPDEHVILDEAISKEPFAPGVRQGDDQWRDLVAWTHYAMIDAEEAGIAQANVEEMRRSALSPDAKRILGLEGKYGEGLGLTTDWAYRIVRHVGQLRRFLRAQCRRADTAEDPARPEWPLEPGRPAIRASDPVRGVWEQDPPPFAGEGARGAGGRGAGTGLSGEGAPLTRPSLTRRPPSPAGGRGVARGGCRHG